MSAGYICLLIAVIIIIVLLDYFIRYSPKDSFTDIPPLKFTPPRRNQTNGDTCRAECLARFGVEDCGCFFDPDGYIESVLPPPIVLFG